MRIYVVCCFFIIVLISGCDYGPHPKFQGYVEGENIYLASPYSGKLQELLIHRGEHVEKNQFLFSLDPDPQQITIAQAQADLQQAQNTLMDLEKPRRTPEIQAIEAQIAQTEELIKLAKLRVSRFQKLYSKGATDQDTLDATISNLQQQQDLQHQYQANLALAKLGGRDDQIKAQKELVNSLTQKLKAAKWELSQKSVYAPASGVIFDSYYRLGEFVPNQQAVLSLLTPDNTRIEFFVPLKYLTRIKVGQQIHFTCEGCDNNNLAVISYVSPDAEYLPPLIYSRENDDKIVFRIKAQIKNPTVYKPGQPVMVIF